MLFFGEELEKKAAIEIGRIMAVAARTAPKSKGIDNIMVALAIDEDIDIIRNKMKEFGEKNNIPFFVRDFKSLENIYGILLIGVRKNPLGLTECGYCGFKNCKEMKEKGGNCFFNIVDLGIAVSSAVNISSTLKVDTRIMYSIGRAAKELQIFPKEYNIILGIPLSVTSKNPFFDREQS